MRLSIFAVLFALLPVKGFASCETILATDSSKVSKAGDTMTGTLIMTNVPVSLTGSSGYVNSNSSVNASGFFANTATFTATGNNQFSLYTSSGIAIAGGCVRWPDGTKTCTAPVNGATGTVTTQGTPTAGAVAIFQGATVISTATSVSVVAGTMTVDMPLKVGAAGTAVQVIYSGTASLDFGSTSANDCTAAQTITVTGAALGDPVFLGAGVAPAATMSWFQAWVSAANTISVMYCTLNDGGSGDPASTTFRATVFHYQ